MNLYELSSDYQALYEALEQNDYETEEEFNDIVESLLSTGEAFDDKAENYVKVVKQLKADEKAIKEEIDRLRKRKESKHKNIEWLLSSLKEEMKRTNKTKIKTPLFSVWVQYNTPSVEMIDGKDVPDDYLIYEAPKPNKKKIKDALKDGEELPFATLKQTEGVRFR